MAPAQPLFELSAGLPRAALAETFARDGRVQVRDVLTPTAADAVRTVLQRDTPWGLAWQAKDQPPASLRAGEVEALDPATRAQMGRMVGGAARDGDYAFLYAHYPMLDAYRGRWQPGGPLDQLLEHINDAPMIELVREVTGIAGLVKADAQATLFGPGHFLAAHDDGRADEGRRIAYVLGFARDWKPDWGGYLLFYDEDGDVVTGFRPRFNTLNLFLVPQRHNVTYVPPFAPVERFAITGWFRDK